MTDASPSRVVGPELVAAKMHLVSPAAPVRGVVVSSARCTASTKAAGFVRHIAISVAGTPLAGSFTAGQSFGVLPEGQDAAGKPHKLRLYSLASPSFGEDGQGTIVATTVKRLIDEHHQTSKLFLGVASNYLCDLEVGATVALTGPSGKRFVLPAKPQEHDYVFIATGTGVAPFRGMVMELLRTAPASRIVLVMGSPYASDLLYDAFFRELAKTHANFTYLTAISRETQRDGGPAMYAHDRLLHSKDVVAPVLASSRGLVYVCGIAGMELGVLQRLVGVLDREAWSQYLDVDEPVLATPAAWTRTMIHKQVRPTRRVFLEVY
jgi:ferredoxin--NADP+ reductase